MASRTEKLAVLAAPAVFVVLWSTGFIGGRYGLPYAEPFTYLSLRMLAVVGILTVILLVTRPQWPDEPLIARSAATGMLIHGVYLGGVFFAMSRGLSPAICALIVCLQPILTSTVANRLLGERVVLHQWIGLFLGLLGVFLVVYDNIDGDTGATSSAWVAAFTALGGITFGTIFQKRYGGTLDWRVGLFIQYAAAAILFCSAAILFETMRVDWDIHFIGALAWMVIVLSFGTVWLLYFLIARSAATRVSSLFYLVPPVTALQAWLIFGDKLGNLALAGMLACVAGVFLVNMRSAA
jgi:drug/metabolite transporter (DMT)-like permease